MSANDVHNVIVSLEDPSSEDARRLISRLDEELCRRYPGLDPHGLHPLDPTDPAFTFVIARIGGLAAGCGALRHLAPATGEVKRMFVLPDFRGRGVARRLLQALESRARELHYTTICLETGTRQPEAIALYTSAGYREIAGFGDFGGKPFSVCFEKRLG